MSEVVSTGYDIWNELNNPSCKKELVVELINQRRSQDRVLGMLEEMHIDAWTAFVDVLTADFILDAAGIPPDEEWKDPDCNEKEVTLRRWGFSRDFYATMITDRKLSAEEVYDTWRKELKRISVYLKEAGLAPEK